MTKGGEKMAYVKHNEDVKNEQDLQNLVIGIIFRQQEPFEAEEIVKIVNYYLKGSKFYDDIEKIEKKVDENLDLLYRRDRVRCWRGIRYPKNPRTGGFPAEYYQAVIGKNKRASANYYG